MRPTGGSCLGNTIVAEVRYRAADDDSFLTAKHPQRQGNPQSHRAPGCVTLIKAALKVAVRAGPARANSLCRDNPPQPWQEWRDSNPQPPVLETGALAS